MAPLWPRVPGPGGMLSDVIWRIANPARTCPCARGRSTSGVDSARTWETEAYTPTSWLCSLDHTCFPSKHLLAFSPRQSIRVEFVSFSSASSEGHISACPKMELARASIASLQLSSPDIFQHVSCRPLSPEIAVLSFFFFPLTQTLVCLVLLKAGNVANSWLCFDFMFLFSHGHSKLSL